MSTQPCQYDNAVYFMDGGAMCIVREDFVDLQESPSIFPECPSCGSGNAARSPEEGIELVCNECGEGYTVDHSALYPPVAAAPIVRPVTDDLVYGRTALREGIPWITPGSLAALEAVIAPDWHVFEWGSGGSTAYWARKCASVISIEHNSLWIDRTGNILSRLGLDKSNVDLRLVRRDPDAKTFHAYANTILDCPDESFDLVFVDGEASCRGWCITNSLFKVKPGGILLVDNSNWLTRDFGIGWAREDFVERELKWVGKKGTFNWWTTILRKA